MKNEIKQILRKWEGNLRRNGSMDVTRFSQVSNEIDNYIRANKNSKVARLLASCRDSTLSPSPDNDKILNNFCIVIHCQKYILESVVVVVATFLKPMIVFNQRK